VPLAAGLDDFARLNACGADIQAAGRALNNRAYALDIRAPTAPCAHMRVRN
jgi:hypothetical protein